MRTNGRGMKRCAGIVALAMMAGPICWSADTKDVKSRDGGCQVSVPADWTVGELGGSAESADKKVSLAVSSPKMIDSFAELKKTSQSVYTSSKVTKSTASDFVMEGESITGKPDVYRAIPVGPSKFCIVEVIYESGGPEAARAVVQTLKVAK